MRKLQFKAKIAKRVIVPPWLVKFFNRVDTMIRRGDQETVTPSDDFIQERGVVGGLIEEGGNLFHFTVFPGPHNPTNRPRWEITISSNTIRQIAERRTDHLDLWECSNPACRNLFSTAESVCASCDYYDDERDERNRVKTELSRRKFKDKEEWVRAYLAHFPEDHPMIIIGQYNSTGLGEKLGWFDTPEIESLIEEFRSSVPETKND